MAKAIPKSSSITGTSLSDWLLLYPGDSLVKSYLSAEKQLVYSTAQDDWASNIDNRAYVDQSEKTESVAVGDCQFLICAIIRQIYDQREEIIISLPHF